MGKAPIITVNNLTAVYEDNLILEKVSFEVREEEILVILGESGCGKTTLLRHMIGLLEPPEGEIIIDGQEITHIDEKTFHQTIKRIGVLYQSSALLTSMSVGENVALPIREHTDLPEEAVKTLVKMKLRLVNLAEYEHFLPSELSGGMRKRAGLARAMALSPKILFFDEPSAGLDPITSAGIDQLILRLNRSLGTTIVIVTHELQSVFAVAHRVIMLDKESKGVIAEGNPAQLRDHSKHPLVRRFFNRLPDNMEE